MKKITLGDREVTVKELTVAEVRQWLLEADAKSGDDFDLVGGMLFDDIDLPTIARMTDLSAADMDALTPSALRDVARACKEVNSHFFSMAGRMGKLLTALDPGGVPDGSNEPAPPSSGTDT